MIERPMPQDIMKFQAKIMAGLSARQIIWGGIGVGVAIGTFFLLKGNVDTSTRNTILMSAVPALPFIFIGFGNIMGEPVEKVALPLAIDNFIAPATRKKEIHNPGFEKYEKKMPCELGTLEEELDENESKKKKSNKSSIRTSTGAVKVIKSKDYIGIK